MATPCSHSTWRTKGVLVKLRGNSHQVASQGLHIKDLWSGCYAVSAANVCVNGSTSHRDVNCGKCVYVGGRLTLEVKLNGKRHWQYKKHSRN